MTTFAPALLFGGCGFAVGVIVGLVLGWRARRGDAAADIAAHRAEMANVEARVDKIMRARYGVAPRVVRQ